MTKKAFVTGWPVSHSKSPVLHGFWLKEHGIDGSYEPVAIAPEDFDKFLEEFQSSGFAGGNITIPHKQQVFDKIVHLDEAATAIGAVNTLWIENGKLHGGNTDAYGFSANLDEHAPQWKKGDFALVLGAGGAARAIVYALIEAGYTDIHIANRTFLRAEDLAADFGVKCHPHPLDQISDLIPKSDLIVNTTSLGMAGQNSGSLPDLGKCKQSAIVTDIVYTPLMTPFLMAAKEQGLVTVDGLGMLLHQAVPGFHKWFGVRPSVTRELRNHILAQQ